MPECENSPSYHEQSDCEYDETPPDEWSKGLVGFKPTSVFDVSQTEGEPLPELETEATGDAQDLVPALLDAADDLGVEVRIVDARRLDGMAARRASANIDVRAIFNQSSRRKPARIRPISP